MARIEFDGQGAPIPTIALPPFGSDSDLPSTVLTYTENTDFPVGQYRDLGFTHFEVWCVGAAGGRGGDASSQLLDIAEVIYRPVPQEVWDYVMEGYRVAYLPDDWNVPKYYYHWREPGNPNYPVGGVPGYDYGWDHSYRQSLEYYNPNHMLQFVTYKQVLLYPSIEGMGGAGGGGGLHRAAGVLADLSDSVSIAVGKAGVDAGYGQIHQNGVWTPSVADIQRANLRSAVVNEYTTSYTPPYSSYPNPQPGGDGGASTFGPVGRASGGKGGGPGMVWDGTKFVPQGFGGDGGIGGRSEAGGGGLGSALEGVNGFDGIWYPDTGIGGGGGGGKGGRQTETSGYNQTPGVVHSTHLVDGAIYIPHLATAGGQGSYSFADTTVYGQRQFRQPWTYMKPVRGYSVIPEPSGTTGAWSNGTVTFVPVSDSSNLVVPGGGGGARPMKNLKVGSRVPGYSPDGVVVVRLSQIT